MRTYFGRDRDQHLEIMVGVVKVFFGWCAYSQFSKSSARKQAGDPDAPFV
jgi:hypothetical protein